MLNIYIENLNFSSGNIITILIGRDYHDYRIPLFVVSVMHVGYVLYLGYLILHFISHFLIFFVLFMILFYLFLLLGARDASRWCNDE